MLRVDLYLLQPQDLINRTLEESGVPEPDTLDKNYWIGRVGEVRDHHISGLVVNCGISNTVVLEIP